MNRWKQSGADLSLEEFTARGRTGSFRSIGQKLCEVPDCERPRRTVAVRVCPAHEYHWSRSSDLTLEDFLKRPNLRPMPSIGPCQVASCYRARGREGRLYCDVHATRLGIERRSGNFNGDEERWRLTTPAVAVDREVSLRGLPDRLVAELLYCLQVRTARDVKTRDHRFRQICDRIRLLQIPSLETLEDADLKQTGMTTDLQMIIRGARIALRRLGSSPETERLKDVWDLVIFGHSRTLNFTKIHQRPLREAVKVWAYDELPRRRGRNVASSMQNMIRGMEQLSDSLRLQREDEGQQLRLLSRTDMVSFCNRIAFLAETGVFGAHHRVNVIRYVRKIVNRIRVMGLTGATR